jgi:methionyl aminopeptidase
MHVRKRQVRLNAEERQCMRRAGRFNAQLMDFIRPYVQAGVTTGELDGLIHEYTFKHGHRPAPLGYPGPKRPYPKSCCISVNNVICHGIPGDYVLKAGDIVNIDITSVVDGWHGDQSETFLIGDVSPEARAVAQCAFDCLYAGIDAVRPNCRVSDIGDAIVALARSRKLSVVQEYVGHGLGREFHQWPSVPHDPTPESRLERIPPGVCFTIEPMINTGRPNTVLDSKDGWTVRTKDGSLSAQFEHTILMGEERAEILTLTQDGPQRGHRF